ncbi:MAG TPA: hypothetical protein VJN70_17840 [Gemmatimonadaceae bacterium]|nr:hypothetical protein [Gemmatimonadaceae bacterium]
MPATTRRLEQFWTAPHNAFAWLATVDHKKLGIRYIVTAFAFFTRRHAAKLVRRSGRVDQQRSGDQTGHANAKDHRVYGSRGTRLGGVRVQPEVTMK